MTPMHPVSNSPQDKQELRHLPASSPTPSAAELCKKVEHLFHQITASHESQLSAACDEEPTYYNFYKEQALIATFFDGMHGVDSIWKDKLFDFCKQYLSQSTLAMNKFFLNENRKCLQGEVVEHTLAILGQIIFLADRQMKKIAQAIDSTIDTEAYIAYIERNFEQEMATVRLELVDYYTRHLHTGLQDAERALDIQINKVVAGLLLTSQRTINSGIIRLVQQKVLDQLPGADVRPKLQSLLECLVDDEELQKILSQAIYPSHAEYISQKSQDIVRITQRLAYDAPIQDLDMAKTALAALLFRLRQRAEKQPFSILQPTAIVKEQMNVYLRDFVQGLQAQRLDLNSEWQPIEASSSPESAGTLNDEIEICQDGKISGKEKFLWEAPGIKAASDYIGIKDAQRAIRHILKEDFDLLGNHIIIKSPLEIVKGLARVYIQSYGKSEGDFDEAVRRGILAFNAQEGNLLLLSITDKS